MLFLGATLEPLLPSSMSFPQATAFGLGALLVLERERRHADALEFADEHGSLATSLEASIVSTERRKR